MFAGRIDIIDYNGGCAIVGHKMEDLGAESMQGILTHAEAIVKALGDNWTIHYNSNDGYIKIGVKNPQTDGARRLLNIEVPTPTMADAWLTTVEIETEYGLPVGSVRRDIHRNKFAEGEIKKVGRDWTIRMDAADRMYDKK